MAQPYELVVRFEDQEPRRPVRPGPAFTLFHPDSVEHRRAEGRLAAQRYRSRLDVARLVAQVDPRLALALLQRRRP